ncbi:MAG: glycosyltransferase family 4 protein [Defluviitaleaceae bacterium]|nr:glycosyltransferase family 4 protein [Defluviitaleaceae bacterium]
MTKILHILTDKNIGGAGHQVLALISAMDTSAFETEVILPEDSRVVPLLAARGITYHEAPNIAEKSFSLAGVRTLYGMIKRLKPDIVHTHSSLSGRIAARIYGPARVVHTRHSAFPIAGWRKRFPIKQLSGLLNNSLSDLVIAISPAAAENLVDMGTAPGKIRTMFNGTPPVGSFTQAEVSDLKQKYGVPPDKFTLAIMARLTEVKGHDDILDAAKAVPESLILAAGDGERQAHLEERIAKEGITNVRLLGWIDKVDEIIAVSNAQLNASFGTETSSLSLILGMSAGSPAIVSDYGGNPYLIQDGVNGLVFKTRDAPAMAKAIQRLKSDPELYKRLSQGARHVYEERFTDKKMASNTEAVYNELI